MRKTTRKREETDHDIARPADKPRTEPETKYAPPSIPRIELNGFPSLKHAAIRFIISDFAQ
jgi:hypothetical protein